VDEGNNWINVSWGPLSMTNPAVLGTDGNYGGGPALGNYAPTAASPVINYIPCASIVAGACRVGATGGLPAVTLPRTDFFGNNRPDSDGTSNAGAVEVP
jgi:hypothetical protein